MNIDNFQVLMRFTINILLKLAFLQSNNINGSYLFYFYSLKLFYHVFLF
jgi:hypothetical protein